MQRDLFTEEMMNVAELLGQKLPFVRVDIYETTKRIAFWDMTFAPEAGRERFIPNRVGF